MSAFESVLGILEHLELKGDVTAPWAKPAWNFEGRFEFAVRLLAETPLTTETDGVARDELVDNVIGAARKLAHFEEARVLADAKEASPEHFERHVAGDRR